MIKTHIFSNPSIDLHISPLSIYVLVGQGENLKSREVLKTIEKRKTVTGNIFSVKAVRKDLVVGGGSRKVLKEALGGANIIAEIFNPGNGILEYLYANIEFNPDNIEETAFQIRQFIKELCVRDIESLKENNNTYLISAKNDLILQLSSLEEYLSKEILKSSYQPVRTSKKQAKDKDTHPLRPKLRNRLSNDSERYVAIDHHLIGSDVAEPDYYLQSDSLYEEKVSFAKKPFLKILSELGWSYEYFKDKMKKANDESIINTKDSLLRFTSSNVPNSRYPGLELKINNHKKITIKIGTKAGCILYGSILFSLYEGKKFKRSDLSEVANQVKKKYKENGNTALSYEDKKSIPLLSWFEGIYKAVFGTRNGTFQHWCIEEYKVTGLNTAATLLKDNIEEVLTGDLSEFKDLLLIRKKAQIKDETKLPQQLYWIDFPIDQVEFPDDRWGNLKKDFNKTKSDTSIKHPQMD